MASKPAIRTVVRKHDGKTVKVTCCLAPQLAKRLKLYALNNDLDLGDVITEGIMPLLAGFSVVQRSADGSSVTTVESHGHGEPAGDTGKPPALRSFG